VSVRDADRDEVRVPYDCLILATGVTHSYFGHNEFEKYAPGLKSLADAVAVRNKILQALNWPRPRRIRPNTGTCSLLFSSVQVPLAWRWPARSP